VALFRSILFSDDAPRLEPEEPDFFVDLHLDQVLASMLAGREQYELEPFFSAPLRGVAAVRYRHEVLRDLERPDVLESITRFASAMRRTRAYLAQVAKLHHPLQKQAWLLDAVEIYCDAVHSLAEELADHSVTSRGFTGLRDYLAEYAVSEAFSSLAAETQALKEALAGVRYAVRIQGARVTVSRYEGEPEYSAEVEETFARFKQGAVKSYLVKLPDYDEMDHVEAQILDRVARLHPDVFGTLAGYTARHRDFLDSTIGRFDREVQFYVACLELVERFRAAGLPFCYPRVSARSKQVAAEQTFDIALANKLVSDGGTVVCNDFLLSEPERILGSPGRITAARRPSRARSGSCTIWPASACSSPAVRRSCSCPTGSTRTSSGRRTSRRCAASSRTSFTACTRSSSARRRTASS
jgi:DNA mismatch repair protein MutS